MRKNFKEVIIAIMPMTILIVILTFVFAPLDVESMGRFILGAIMMMVGMSLFLFGADYSMMEVGDLVGKYMIKKKSLPIVISLGFLIGIVITIAEPSVQVLGQQVFDISDGEIGRVLLIGIVSVGTGVFLAFALLRVVFKLSYYRLMVIGYLAVLIASFFTSNEFMPIAFDAGGVTTGPVTVPFILALAGGMTSMIRQGKNENDSFGMVGIASLGPILAVMILGGDLPMNFLVTFFTGIGQVGYEVILAVAPIVILFVLMNFLSFKLRKKRFLDIMKGFLITTIGLILFLHGVNVAYVPVGQHLGSAIASLANNQILIPLGFVMGFLVGFAEPAIHVMVKQVEELSEGRIHAKVMLAVISIGIGLAVGLSMWRLLAGFTLYYFLVPGYGLAFVLGAKVDKIFLSMAFDNGGVATGPMCSTFILSMSVAIATQIDGRDPIIDGFGVVAMIALTPILSTLVLGFIYKQKDKKDQKNKEKLQQMEEQQ